MCGITGFVSKSKNKDQILKKMLKRIEHRGPDGEGTYIDDDVALGHRRLSIIDLSTGNQPMFNEDNSLVVIFNGEIYNYQELKEELLKKGHTFKTTSDTEVLLHGYEEYKKDLPKKLRGMFTFVLYDKNNKEMFGARDHFGIKPFYYYKLEDNFMFASEIKSFLENPNFRKELNEKVLSEYLRFNYVPSDETFFKNVYKLSPGHYFTYVNNKLDIKPYFNLTFDEQVKDYEKIVDAIATTMEDSVKHHKISDVEVGSFLSSGIDSSYIVSLAKPDKTYTVGYDIEKYNEIDYAKDLADKLNIKNTSKKITKEEYFKVIPDIMYYMDEPLADPAAVALYFVAELASHDVKVVLSGEGADEFFGGYNTYRKDVDMSFYNKIPFVIRNIIAKVGQKLPEIKGINFLVRRGLSLEESYIGVNTVFTEKSVKKILKNNSYFRKNKDITKDVFVKQQGKSDIIKMQAIDINFWLQKDILEKADKMTMAHSIEGRVPFSDIEVFKLARTLPYEAKVTNKNTKVALRDAAHKVIPNESYKKKKLGFPVPLREWIKEDDIYIKIKQSFDMPICKQLFNTKKLNKMLDQHKEGKKDYYKKIWTVYCFLVWYDDFFIKEK